MYSVFSRDSDVRRDALQNDQEKKKDYWGGNLFPTHTLILLYLALKDNLSSPLIERQKKRVL